MTAPDRQLPSDGPDVDRQTPPQVPEIKAIDLIFRDDPKAYEDDCGHPCIEWPIETEACRVNSPKFREHLASAYYQAYREVLSEKSIKRVQLAVAGKAREQVSTLDSLPLHATGVYGILLESALSFVYRQYKNEHRTVHNLSWASLSAHLKGSAAHTGRAAWEIPSDSAVLGKNFRRLVEPLKKFGIEVTFYRTAEGRFARLELTDPSKLEIHASDGKTKPSDVPVTPNPASGNDLRGNDGGDAAKPRRDFSRIRAKPQGDKPT